MGWAREDCTVYYEMRGQGAGVQAAAREVNEGGWTLVTTVEQFVKVPDFRCWPVIISVDERL